MTSLSISTCRPPSTTRSKPSKRQRPTVRSWSSSPNCPSPVTAISRWRSPRGPEYTGIWAEYLRHGIEVPSEETDILCRAARQSKVNVVDGHQRAGGQDTAAASTTRRCSSTTGARSSHVHRKINITVQELLDPHPGQRRQEPVGPRVRFRQGERAHLRRAQPADALEQLHHPGRKGELLHVAGISRAAPRNCPG